MSIQTECGIFSIFSKKEMNLLYILNKLHKLQHRGRDSFGYSYFQSIKKNRLISNQDNHDNQDNHKYLIVEKRLGLISNFINNNSNKNSNYHETIISNNWLSHVRYSTINNKEVNLNNIQPIKSKNILLGDYSLAHNGNIPTRIWESVLDSYPLLKLENFVISNNSDTCLLVKFINYLSNMENIYNEKKSSKKKFMNVLKILLDIIPYAYCIVIQTSTNMWFIRDKNGVRPLSIYYNDDTIISSSESIILDKQELLNYNIKHILNGQICLCNLENTIISPEIIFTYKHKLKSCIFEYLYFMNLNTVTNEDSVIEFRNRISKELASQILNNNKKLYQHWKNNNAIISGVPSSGNYYGIQLANYLDLSYVQFLEKNINDRTFIMGSNKERLEECQKKYKINPKVNINNKILVLVDDSIVRGNTLSYLVSYLRKYEPKEIHIISASPPIKHPCNYGVDFPDIEELVYNKIEPSKLHQKLNVASITYLNITNLSKIKKKSCLACFNGKELQ
jgi:amidophosphoribosyltransferase